MEDQTNSENALRKLEAKLETYQEELVKAKQNIINLTEEKETLLKQPQWPKAQCT